MAMMHGVEIKVYILHNVLNGNYVGVYRDLKMARSIAKKMNKSGMGMYVILEADVTKHVE